MTKVLNLVKPQEWTISLNLNYAYMHIQIVPNNGQFLLFCIQGQCFWWKVLRFGKTLSPWCFTKIVAVVAAHLRAQLIRLA